MCLQAGAHTSACETKVSTTTPDSFMQSPDLSSQLFVLCLHLYCCKCLLLPLFIGCLDTHVSEPIPSSNSIDNNQHKSTTCEHIKAVLPRRQTQEERMLKRSIFPLLTGLPCGHLQYRINHCTCLSYLMPFYNTTTKQVLASM